MKRKCQNFDEIFVTGCTENCQNDASVKKKVIKNDSISVSLYSGLCCRI